MMKPAAVKIRLPWGTLEGIHWSNPGAAKILCLHGWLDNAASFVPLSPYLQKFDLIALDFAGHGFSSHRPVASHYYLNENLYDVDAALDKLGWNSCNIIGHSMGGGVASAFAAAVPERVNKLVLLDGVGIVSQPASKAARQLQLSVQSVRKERGVLRPYESVEQAMQARQKKASLSDDAARLICERSLEHTGDYYQWRTDPRLTWRSPQWFTHEQVLSLLSAIRARTLTMISPEALEVIGEKNLGERLAAIADCRQLSVNGNHHFHMELAEYTGNHIATFLEEN